MFDSLISALAPALFGSIFGADEPTYQQPSMDQIMTPVQKALSDLIIERSKSAAGWAKKFEDDMPRRVSEWENQKKNYMNQTPTTTVNKPSEIAPAVEEKPKETPNTIQSNPYMDTLFKASQEKRLTPGASGFQQGISNYGQAMVNAMDKAGLTPDELITERTGLSPEQRKAMGADNAYYLQMMPDLANKIAGIYGESQKQNEQQALIKKLQGVK